LKFEICISRHPGETFPQGGFLRDNCEDAVQQKPRPGASQFRFCAIAHRYESIRFKKTYTKYAKKDFT
jgi:hypothetical protein